MALIRLLTSVRAIAENAPIHAYQLARMLCRSACLARRALRRFAAH